MTKTLAATLLLIFFFAPQPSAGQSGQESETTL